MTAVCGSPSGAAASVVSISRHTCGTQSAVGVKRLRRARSAAMAPTAPASPVRPGCRRRVADPDSVSCATVHQPDPQHPGGLVDEHLKLVELAVRGGDVVDQFEFTVRLQQAGVRPDAVDPHPDQLFGRGDQHVGHRAGRQVDHQVVDRVAGGALHDVEGQDVGAYRAEGHGERTEAARSVVQLDPQQIRRHAQHFVTECTASDRARIAALRGGIAAGRVGLGLWLVSQISRDDVAHLARLARLALTDDELDSFAGQLDAILEHVSRIQAVDVTGVEPTGNPLKDVNVTRPDTVVPSLTPAARRWPRRREAEEGRFAVPQILGESRVTDADPAVDAADAGRQDRRQGGLVGRGHPGVPGPDRRAPTATTTPSCTSPVTRRWPRPPTSTRPCRR